MELMDKVILVSEKLNRMPVNYRTFNGTECQTFYTTVEFLQDIVFKIGSDNTVERDYRSLHESCLKEFGFKYIAIYIEPSTGRAVAILGM